MNTFRLSKLILGIDPSSDIHTMLQDGIRQFYFGYLDADYEKTYGTQTPLNRRYRAKEQFSDLAEIYETIDTIHQHGGTIHLALNSFTNNDTMQAEACRQLKLFAHKVDAIIVANIGMGLWLKTLKYENIVTSNLFGVYSIEAVVYLQEALNPIKIILPRDIALDDIKKIVTHFPKQSFECFLYGDNCRYSESFCFVEHGYDSVGFGSLCSFAMTHKQAVSVPTPAYKQIIKHSKYTDEEKRKLLAQTPMSITNLLEQIELALHTQDTQQLHKSIEILSRYDTVHFGKEPSLYIRAIRLLKEIETPQAKALKATLNNYIPSTDDGYKTFHKLNTTAISQTLSFFEKLDNIVSYKIPSRGREHYRHLFNKSNETYNYKQSQYRL